jgi:hypothetical protein
MPGPLPCKAAAEADGAGVAQVVGMAEL